MGLDCFVTFHHVRIQLLPVISSGQGVYKKQLEAEFSVTKKLERKMTLNKLTTYTYRLSKRPLTNYGFQFNKDENPGSVSSDSSVSRILS